MLRRIISIDMEWSLEMRVFLFSALAVLAASLLDSGPARAAWTCVGAEYVCGGAQKSSVKRYGKPSAARHAKGHRLKAAQKSRRALKSRTASRRSYKKVATRAARRAGAPQVRAGRSAQTGIASYYWQPQAVASGGRFNPNAMTAAHKTLPFGTRVRVTNLRSGRSVDVIINDRGPYVRGRVIDLSRAAAGAIGMRGAGLAPVRVDVIGRG